MKIILKCIFKDSEEKDVILSWDGCVAAGYTGRNREAVLAHIEELKKLGVPAPEKVPATYWIDPNRVTKEDKIYVIGEKTSGEVEVFIAKGEDGKTYVTVGSDHTDRELEKISVSKAKQICSKVIAPSCWEASEILDHWDELILRMEVKRKEDADYLLYQEGTLSKIIPLKELERLAFEEKPKNVKLPSIFSGTVPILRGEPIFANLYRMTLTDPVLNRKISHSYEVISLPDKI